MRALLFLSLAACGNITAQGSLDKPLQAGSGGVGEKAVTEAVQAYLRTNKIDEKNLVVGLQIPYSFMLNGACVGAARVTGKTGPLGHMVYELIELHWDGAGPHNFLEVAP